MLPSFTLPKLSLAGLIPHLKIGLPDFPFFDLSVNFDLGPAKVSLDVNGDGKADVTGARLLDFGFSGISGTIGDTSGPHITVTGGSLAMAVIVNPASGAANWTALTGSLTGATFSGGGDFGLSITDLAASMNRAGGTYKTGSGQTAVTNTATPINWTTALDLDLDGSFGTAADQLIVNGTPITLTTGGTAASGTATVTVPGLLSGSVSFSYAQQTVNADLTPGGDYSSTANGNPPARGPPNFLTSATLTTIGLSIPANGSISIGSGATALTVASGTLAVAILAP